MQSPEGDSALQFGRFFFFIFYFVAACTRVRFEPRVYFSMCKRPVLLLRDASDNVCKHRRTGPVSFRGAEVSCPNILSIACPKIKWFCPNITHFLPENCYFDISRGLQPPPPPASYAYVCKECNWVEAKHFANQLSRDWMSCGELTKMNWNRCNHSGLKERTFNGRDWYWPELLATKLKVNFNSYSVIQEINRMYLAAIPRFQDHIISNTQKKDKHIVKFVKRDDFRT